MVSDEESEGGRGRKMDWRKEGRALQGTTPSAGTASLRFIDLFGAHKPRDNFFLPFFVRNVRGLSNFIFDFNVLEGKCLDDRSRLQFHTQDRGLQQFDNYS